MLHLDTGLQLDKRRETKKGFPVKIRVTYNRQPRYYSTGIYLSEEDFEKVIGKGRKSENLKAIKTKLEKFQKKADDVIEKQGDDFTFDSFKSLYLDKPISKSDVTSYFDNYIAELIEEGRATTASSYRCARNSIQDFIGKKRVIQFSDVNVKWLNKYESFMLKQGRSNTTIGIYLRSLRTLFNAAIENAILSKDKYPFGKRKYEIPASRNIKKALSKSDLKRIYEYQPSKDTWEEKAHSFWLFSYFCKGMNVKDICNLKHKNLSDKKIIFVRAKTKRSTKANQKEISITRTEDINKIISKYGTRTLSPDRNVFPFLDGTESPEREMTIVQQTTKNINNGMKKIAMALEIDDSVTTYTARHSFATMLKRGGAPTEFISESLGHSNLQTTESYLDSFEDETEEKYSKTLTDFG